MARSLLNAAAEELVRKRRCNQGEQHPPDGIRTGSIQFTAGEMYGILTL
ncbi:MAG: hypothetical protein MRJ68_19885 [Nitrospira sp.]|nr:hypothetical protein [Nitrospira sp.]